MTYVANCADDCTADTAAASKWIKSTRLGRKLQVAIDSRRIRMTGRHTLLLFLLTCLLVSIVVTPLCGSSVFALIDIVSWTFTGSHLVRDEIIALQTTTTQGDAEFYPFPTLRHER
jgi:hypothetical protein